METTESDQIDALKNNVSKHQKYTNFPRLNLYWVY